MKTISPKRAVLIYLLQYTGSITLNIFFFLFKEVKAQIWRIEKFKNQELGRKSITKVLINFSEKVI